MTTYLALNLVYAVVSSSLLIVFGGASFNRWFWYTLMVILFLTAVFDSLIVASGIVGYDYAKTIGILIVRAPIEDFFYAVVAVIGTVVLWEHYEKS